MAEKWACTKQGALEDIQRDEQVLLERERLPKGVRDDKWPQSLKALFPTAGNGVSSLLAAIYPFLLPSVRCPSQPLPSSGPHVLLLPPAFCPDHTYWPTAVLGWSRASRELIPTARPVQTMVLVNIGHDWHENHLL